MTNEEKRKDSLKRAYKKYANTEKGKIARMKAMTKSYGKRFIVEYSTEKDLEEYVSLIEERKSLLEKI